MLFPRVPVCALKFHAVTVSGSQVLARTYKSTDGIPKSLQDSLRHRYCVPRCVPHSSDQIAKIIDWLRGAAENLRPKRVGAPAPLLALPARPAAGISRIHRMS